MIDATSPQKRDSVQALIAAMIDKVRSGGYSATSVDDVCREAGFSKGAFFHHFKSKEELAVSAAEAWREKAASEFLAAPYQQLADPADRILGYIDLRRSMLTGRAETFSCFAGTMLQEAFATSEAIRSACGSTIIEHAQSLEPDIAAAMAEAGVHAWTPSSLCLHIQAVLQGAFIIAKATNNPQQAVECVDHLYRYVALLFGRSPTSKEPI